MRKDIEVTTKNIQTKKEKLQQKEDGEMKMADGEMRAQTTMGICKSAENVTCERGIRNETVGHCLSANACGFIDKHPEEKDRKRKLETDIASDTTSLNKLQENYRKKQVSYTVRSVTLSQVELKRISLRVTPLCT